LRLVALEDPTHHFWRLLPIINHFHLYSETLEGFPTFYKILRDDKPEKSYHLAAQNLVSI